MTEKTGREAITPHPKGTYMNGWWCLVCKKFAKLSEQSGSGKCLTCGLMAIIYLEGRTNHLVDAVNLHPTLVGLLTDVLKHTNVDEVLGGSLYIEIINALAQMGD